MIATQVAPMPAFIEAQPERDTTAKLAASAAPSPAETADTLATAAAEIGASLRKSAGNSHFIIDLETGMTLAGSRLGQAATIIATRHGDRPIGGKELETIATEAGLPYAAQWQILHYRGLHGMNVQIAYIPFTIGS